MALASQVTGTLPNANLPSAISISTLSLTSTTNSSSSSTGALLVSGGMGLAGSLYVGTNLNVGGTTNLIGTTTVGTLIGTSTTNSNSSVTGALQIAGGTGIAGSLYVGGTIYQNNAAMATQSYVTGSFQPLNSNLTTVASLTQSSGSFVTSSGTSYQFSTPAQVSTILGLGALATLNNVALASQVSGTLLNANLPSAMSTSSLNLTATTTTSSIATGALTVSGGIGLAGSLYVGTNLNVAGTTVLTGSVTVPTPVSATDAGRKDYIDAMSYLTASTGLTKTGNSLSVNASQGQITTIGTLTSLTLGSLFTQLASTYTNTAAAASSTVAQWSYNTINAPTLAATNTNVTTTSAATCYISGPPTAGTNQTLTNAYALQIGSGNALIANLTFSPFQTTGGWINMPVTASSGIGSGGPGGNCWIAYAAGAASWFTNSTAGDICYRNTVGKLLFGTSYGNASMVLSGDLLGIGTSTPGVKLDVVGDIRLTGTLTGTYTINSTSSVTGALQVAGGAGIAKSLYVGTNLNVAGTTVLTGTTTVPTPVNTTDAEEKITLMDCRISRRRRD